jgi:hypothetical protein
MKFVMQKCHLYILVFINLVPLKAPETSMKINGFHEVCV